MAVQTKAKYRRVLLKLSGEALLGDLKFGISPEYTRYLAEEIRKVHDLGVQVAVVIGGGNIMRGAAVAEHGIEEATGHYMGMLAMVINALALQSQIESVGVPVRVQSAITRSPSPTSGAGRSTTSRRGTSSFSRQAREIRSSRATPRPRCAPRRSMRT